MPIDEQPIGIPNPDENTPHSKGAIRAVALVGLLPLTGSQADIAAADEIRARVLIEADDVLTHLRSDNTLTESQIDTAVTPDQPTTPTQVHEAQVALNRLRHQLDAAWWLPRSTAAAAQLIDETVAQIRAEKASG